MQTALAIIGAYCLGSISFAIVVSRLMRLPDPRSYGSKNPGATNVLRTGNKAAAALTLLGDAAKGLVAVLLARALATRYGFGDGTIAAAPVNTPNARAYGTLSSSSPIQVRTPSTSMASS